MHVGLFWYIMQASFEKTNLKASYVTGQRCCVTCHQGLLCQKPTWRGLKRGGVFRHSRHKFMTYWESSLFTNPYLLILKKIDQVWHTESRVACQTMLIRSVSLFWLAEYAFRPLLAQTTPCWYKTWEWPSFGILSMRVGLCQHKPHHGDKRYDPLLASWVYIQASFSISSTRIGLFWLSEYVYRPLLAQTTPCWYETWGWASFGILSLHISFVTQNVYRPLLAQDIGLFWRTTEASFGFWHVERATNWHKKDVHLWR